jgi:pimeloyl-ACP methyl ester carboxylesterase
MRRVLAAGAASVALLMIVFNTWVDAQGRAFLVLATTIETPVLSWTARALTREPLVEEAIVAGRPTTLVRPAGDPPWPTVVFVNGATRRGRFHPDVQRLARGLARAGFVVFVPDLPGLSSGELTLRTVRATVAVADAAARSPDSKGDRVGFAAVSVGASLALLAAEDARLASRVTAVCGIAPYARIKQVIKLATTGYGPTGRYVVDDYVALAVGRSLLAGLPSSPDRDRLLRTLEQVPDERRRPLAVLATEEPRVPEVRAVVALLRNRDPLRFESMFARLPSDLRVKLERLSPFKRAQAIEAEVHLASARTDKYFPPAESRMLVRAAPHARLTATTTLEHAIPHPNLRDIADLVRFDGWVVRSLRALR